MIAEVILSLANFQTSARIKDKNATHKRLGALLPTECILRTLSVLRAMAGPEVV